MTKRERIEALRAEFRKATRQVERETLQITVPPQDDADWIFIGICAEDVGSIVHSHNWFTEQMSKAYVENLTTPGMYGVCLSIRKLHEVDTSDENTERLKAGEEKAKKLCKEYKEKERLIMEEE